MAPNAATVEANVAESRSGRLHGKTANGVTYWLGVPYARAQRFGAPRPYPEWKGTRSALKMAPQCPQHFFGSAKRALVDAPTHGEDCLALNVWAPEDAEPGSRPVLVWIHGGAFLAGASNQYDGSELARLGDMVVVAINYRLGVLGFVNFGEALGLRDIPSNPGLRDQVAALEWVRDNIAAFGGDPRRVTISGQSAGSMSCAALMMASQARPLFTGAILMSGTTSRIHDREHSLRNAMRYAEILGMNEGSLEELRSMDLRRLFEAQAQVGRETRNGIPAAPWFDADLLPASHEEAKMLQTPAIPLIAGATKEEVRLFEFLPGDILPVKWPDLETPIRAQLAPAQANALLAAYPRTKAGRRALGTDLTFLMPTRNLAERHSRHSPTWCYRFDYSHPLVGAAHGIDMAFLWPVSGVLAVLFRGGLMRGRRAALADRIKRNWIHFVHHGRPESDWLPYTPDSPWVKLFDLSDGLVMNPESKRFAAWGGRDIARV